VRGVPGNRHPYRDSRRPPGRLSLRGGPCATPPVCGHAALCLYTLAAALRTGELNFILSPILGCLTILGKSGSRARSPPRPEGTRSRLGKCLQTGAPVSEPRPSERVKKSWGHACELLQAIVSMKPARSVPDFFYTFSGSGFRGRTSKIPTTVKPPRSSARLRLV
jgi:hypothetical protein